MAIEANGPVDGRSRISSDQPVGVLSCTDDAVEPPDLIRFTIQKVHRLQLTGVKDRYEVIAHRADVLDLENEPARRSLNNLHSVDGFASKIIDLLEVEHLTFFHFSELKVFAALTVLRVVQSVSVHN